MQARYRAVGAASHGEPAEPQSTQQFVDTIAARATSLGAAAPPGAPVRYRTIEYSAVVANPGAPGSFTAFVRVARTRTIQPSSAASIDTFPDGPLAFTTRADRARWQAVGSPPLAPGPSGGSLLSLPAGQFSFIPQGSTLTYQQARSLPATPRALIQLLSHLRAFAGPRPPANLVLRQLGYLIAAAPLTSAARAAAWRVLAALPGLHLCGSGTDLAHRRGQELASAPPVSGPRSSSARPAARCSRSRTGCCARTACTPWCLAAAWSRRRPSSHQASHSGMGRWAGRDDAGRAAGWLLRRELCPARNPYGAGVHELVDDLCRNTPDLWATWG